MNLSVGNLYMFCNSYRIIAQYTLYANNLYHQSCGHGDSNEACCSSRSGMSVFGE
jgi:hypothetical protein